MAAAGLESLGGDSQVVTRLSAESRVREGGDVELWFDANKVALFDQRSGKNLTLD